MAASSLVERVPRAVWMGMAAVGLVSLGAAGALVVTGGRDDARAAASPSASASAPVASPAATPSAPASTPPSTVTASLPDTADDWLRTDGARIVDLDGNPVWLTGANWFGFNTSERVLHGLWSADLGATLDAISARGLNVLRVPISTELLWEWRDGEAQVSGSVNQGGSLAGMTTLEVFDAFLAGCKERGVKVILDVHSALADNSGHLAPVWYAGDVTAADFVAGWEWIAERSRGDDTIIGFDLKNEPHGQPGQSPRATWDGSTDPDNWRHVAQELALRILEIHPDVLVLVEGVEATAREGADPSSTDPADYDFGWWGGNLRGVADHPIELGEFQDRLVYSPHDYGPLVFEQPWFRGDFTAESLEAEVWEPQWLFIANEGIAPLLIGEWGGRLGQDARQDRWMAALRDLIVERRLHHTFWAINPNSGDTGGLLLDDWTRWDENKYALLEAALWQDAQGRFVSLDHKTPLRGGVTVTQYYDGGGTAPVGTS